jgi:hypothetical protein
MAIVAADIKKRLSGGAGNSDVNLSLGGIISSTAITDNVLNNLFDDVSGTESLPGDTEYRGIYVLNGHGTLTMKNTRVYISSNTTSADDEIDLALAGEGLNVTMETVANENTAPVGETFSHPTTYAGGLNMGDIPAGQRYGLWVKRIVNAAAGAIDNNAAILNVDCDTSA